MTEPKRWRSDPSRLAAADLLLRAARCPRSPGPEDLDRLEKIVCDIPRRVAHRKRRIARIIAGVAGLALSASLGTSVWAWRRAGDGLRAVAAPAPTCLSESPRREPGRASGRPPIIVPPRKAVLRLGRHAGRVASVQPPRMDPQPTSLQPSIDPLMRETELIAAARSTIGSTPTAALASLDEHRREFSEGQLAPEREFLAVDALRRLNRLTEAHQRALDLSSRFPSSSYGARAKQLLDVAASDPDGLATR